MTMFASKTPRDLNHVQHNEPNPILTEIRNEMSEGYPLDIPRELAWLARGDLYWVNYPEGAREHARKVLTRLAELAAVVS